MVALFFAVYTAIQRTRIVPAALRAIQHIHLVYSTYSIQPYSLTPYIPIHLPSGGDPSCEHEERLRDDPKRPAGVRGENPSTWDEVYSLDG